MKIITKFIVISSDAFKEFVRGEVFIIHPSYAYEDLFIRISKSHEDLLSVSLKYDQNTLQREAKSKSIIILETEDL